MNYSGKEFMEKTKHQYLGESDQQKGLPQPALELDYEQDASVVKLPDISGTEIGTLSVQEAIQGRRTVREYSEGFLTLKELSYLLWATQGVREITARPVTLRTVPSAGARHALETYLYIDRVKGLKKGLYRYIATEHKLLLLDDSPEFEPKLCDTVGQQDFILDSAVIFVWTAVIHRMQWRYGARSYRYIHLDAGHVCQNLYLAAQSISCGTCAVGGFDDDRWNALLDIDGEDEFVVYLAPLGKV